MKDTDRNKSTLKKIYPKRSVSDNFEKKVLMKKAQKVA